MLGAAGVVGVEGGKAGDQGGIESEDGVAGVWFNGSTGDGDAGSEPGQDEAGGGV